MTDWSPPDAWRYLSLSWRAPMREPEPEKVPVGLPLPDLTLDQFARSATGCSVRSGYKIHNQRRSEVSPASGSPQRTRVGCRP